MGKVTLLFNTGFFCSSNGYTQNLHQYIFGVGYFDCSMFLVLSLFSSVWLVFDRRKHVYDRAGILVCL
jgi:hypothetical protein